MIRRQVTTGLLMTVVLTLLLGVAYPLAVTAMAQITMSDTANGSLVVRGGNVVGSALIGQSFLDAKGNPNLRYFQPRPSAAGTGYDAMASGGSNLGPSNPTLLETIAARASLYRKLNGLSADAPIPSDAVTASASGLDPQISIANARLQAPHIAKLRSLPISRVRSLIDAHTSQRPFGFLGEPGVNVLELNLALDTEGRP